MEKGKGGKTYYEENVELLIGKLKTSVSQTLDVIDREFDEDLTGDKYVNVLKAKRQASEDVIWTLKRIQELEDELNGVEEVTEEKAVSTNPAKKYSKR
jgi:hypothetical protein